MPFVTGVLDDTYTVDYHCRIHVPGEWFSDYCEICVRQRECGLTAPKCGKFTEEDKGA